MAKKVILFFVIKPKVNKYKLKKVLFVYANVLINGQKYRFRYINWI
jgi:hypothetical protein